MRRWRSGPRPAFQSLYHRYDGGSGQDGPAILLLKKREEKFMSSDTLIIACNAGAASGVVAHSLPALTALVSGLDARLGVSAILGTAAFGCVIGAGAAAIAITTQWLLNLRPHP